MVRVSLSFEARDQGERALLRCEYVTLPSRNGLVEYFIFLILLIAGQITGRTFNTFSFIHTRRACKVLLFPKFLRKTQWHSINYIVSKSGNGNGNRTGTGTGNRQI